MAASASWEGLGETFYRRQDIYSMQWAIADLSDYITVGARWGGPIGELLAPNPFTFPSKLTMMISQPLCAIAASRSSSRVVQHPSPNPASLYTPQPAGFSKRLRCVFISISHNAPC